MIKHSLTALTRLAVGLGFLSAVQATYLVNTNVGATTGNNNNGASYGYNWNYVGNNGPTTGPVGSVSSINCSFPCTYTVSGTVEHTGTLTAANDQASIVTPVASASGTASANLATGKIGVSATGTYLLVQGSQAGGETSSAGYLQDVLHFNLGGLSSAIIGVTFSTSGTVVAGGGNTLVNPHLTFNDAQVNADVGDNGTSPYIQSSNEFN